MMLFSCRRIYLCAIVAILALFTATSAHAVPVITATLAITYNGAPATTVDSKSVVTLTAMVTTAGTPATSGQVVFCDADATACLDIHILGTAQIQPDGTATLRYIPPGGTHHYKAVATISGATSASSPVSLVVNHPAYTTQVSISSPTTGTIAATVTGNGPIIPTGTVSFVDQDTFNVTSTTTYPIGTETLSAGVNQAPTDEGGYPEASTGNIPFFLLAADFNNDGYPDLLATYTQGAPPSSVPASAPASIVRLSPGASTPGAVQTVGIPYGCGSAVAADFNDDGNPDIAVFITGSSAPSFFAGHGDGTFSGPTLATDAACALVFTADINRDGQPDLIVPGDNQINLWIGAGDGTFSAGPPISVTSMNSFQIGDFNGDGAPDLLVVNTTTSLSIFFNSGDGSFNSPITSTQAGLSGSPLVADFNNDGKSDLYLGNVLLSNGDGSFTKAPTTASSNTVSQLSKSVSAAAVSTTVQPSLVAVGDFNGDGKVDLGLPSGGTINNDPFSGTEDNSAGGVLFGNGDGTFTSGNLTVGDISYGSGAGDYVYTFGVQTAIATDINGDGIADIYAGSEVTGFDRLGGPNINTGFELTFSPVFSSATASVTPASLPDSGLTGANIGVSYAGDSVYTVTGSTPPSASAFITGIPFSDLILTADNPKPFAGRPVTLTATLTPYSAQGLTTDGELVSFMDGSLTAPLHGGIATVTTSFPIAGGNSADARYPGDGHFAPAINNVNVTVQQITPTLSLTVSNSTPYVGQPVTLTATLTPASSQGFTTDGELVSFIEGSLTAPLHGGVATVTTSFSTAGIPPSVDASYSGDGPFAPAVAYASVTVQPSYLGFTVPNHTYGDAPFALAATSPSGGTITYSVVSGPVALSGNTVTIKGVGPATLMASISAVGKYPAETQTATFSIQQGHLTLLANNVARVYGAANPTFTGTLTGAVYSDTFTESFSTTATTASPFGSYSIVPSVTGAALANYTVSATDGTLSIGQAGTETTFALSNNNTSITANVTSLTTGMPTGSVTFLQGQTSLGTAMLVNGVATLNSVTIPSGDVVLSAQYGGDTDFTQSATPSIPLLSMSPANTSLSATTSGTVTDTLTVSAMPGYTGSVQLACTNLPSNATCSFTPSSPIAFSAKSSTVTAMVTLHTGATAQSALATDRLPLLAAVIGAPALFSLLCLRLRKGYAGATLLLFLLLASVTLISACGGGGSPSSSSPPPPTTQGSSTPAGTYTVNVVATGPGGLTQTTPITLTVH